MKQNDGMLHFKHRGLSLLMVLCLLAFNVTPDTWMMISADDFDGTQPEVTTVTEPEKTPASEPGATSAPIVVTESTTTATNSAPELEDSTSTLTADTTQATTEASLPEPVTPVTPESLPITFDLAYGSVLLGADYSGKDSSGNTVSGTHSAENEYVITQSNPETATTNQIIFSGSELTFDVTIDGINTFPVAPRSSNTYESASIIVVACAENASILNSGKKNVTLRLRGNNFSGPITYYTVSTDMITIRSESVPASTLKITSAAGDGSLDGCLTIHNEAERFACIGGTGSSSYVSGLTIAGGTINAYQNNVADNGCDATIGGGSNGYADVTITGGNVTATINGNAPAIGAGGGVTAVGASANVIITGGTVDARNNGNGVAIGGGSSENMAGGNSEIVISGGNISAINANGYAAIGGGNSKSGVPGAGNVTISGGTITASGIGSGVNTQTGLFGTTGVLTFTGGSIQSRVSATPTNGSEMVYLTRATLYHTNEIRRNVQVSSLNVVGIAATYGCTDVFTDDMGGLYLWLPANAELTKAMGDAAYVGSVAANAVGILTFNSSASFYSARFPYSDRISFYTDAACSSVLSGMLTAPSGGLVEFWARTSMANDTAHYGITAYRPNGSHVMSLFSPEADSDAENGVFHYKFNITSNTALWFVSTDVSGQNRIVLDLSDGAAVVEEASAGQFRVSVGGYILDTYTGTFLLTSSGMPTSASLTVKSGTAQMRMDRFVASAAGSTILVESGSTLQLEVSGFENTITSTGDTPVVVRDGAVLELCSDQPNEFLKITAEAAGYSAIGGAGTVHLTKTAGTLELTSGAGATSITAQRYSYTATQMSSARLPYTMTPTQGILVGYSSAGSLYLPNALYTCAFGTVFTACSVGFLPADGNATASVTDGALVISLPNRSAESFTVAKDGAAFTGYTWDEATKAATIAPTDAAGAFLITLLSSSSDGGSGIIYHAANYIAAYNGATHHFVVQVINAAEPTVVWYSTDEYNWSTTPPSKTNAGEDIIFWKIVSENQEPVTGSSRFSVSMGVNQWNVSLSCPSILQGDCPNPNAGAKWGLATYSYSDTVNGTYTDIVPSVPGSYYVRATVAGTGNYSTLLSEPVLFTIESTAIYVMKGKVYDPLNHAAGAIHSTFLADIPANGAFSVLYSFSYIPDYANKPLTLQFSQQLPAGTKLVALDICSAHTSRFFYYIVPSGGMTQIASDCFYLMGSNATGSFESNDANHARTVAFQFCVQFPAMAETEGALTLSLSQNQTLLPNSTVTVDRIAPQTENGNISMTDATGGEAALTAAATITAAADSVLALTLMGNNILSQQVTLTSSCGELLTPYRTADCTAFFRLNGSAQSNARYTISYTELRAGSYRLHAALCVTPKNDNSPMCECVADATVEGIVVVVPEYQLTVTPMQEADRILTGESEIVLHFQLNATQLPCLDARTFPAVTVQRKGATGYTALSAQWTVDGVNNPVQQSEVSRGYVLTVTVPAAMAPGTYRLVFGFGTAVFNYNLIVTS